MKLTAVVCAALLALSAPAAAARTTLFSDNFDGDSFSPSTPGSPYDWSSVVYGRQRQSAGPTTDGCAVLADSCLELTWAQSRDGSDPLSDVTPFCFFNAGAPGASFQVPDGTTIEFAASASARFFNLANQPFGSAVANVTDDPRLPSAAFYAASGNTRLTAGFILTSDGVWAEHRRLPGGQPDDAYWEASRRVANPPIGDAQLDLVIAYNNTANSLSWYVDGDLVLVRDSDQLGLRPAVPDWPVGGYGSASGADAHGLLDGLNDWTYAFEIRQIGAQYAGSEAAPGLYAVFPADQLPLTAPSSFVADITQPTSLVYEPQRAGGHARLCGLSVTLDTGGDPPAFDRGTGKYYSRYAPASPEGTPHVNPRAISNALGAYDPDETYSVDSRCAIAPNARGMSALVWSHLQLFDHKVSLTHASADNGRIEWDTSCDPVADPDCAGATAGINRSKHVVVNGQRQQVNELNPYWDASCVYGFNSERADALRAHVGGQLAVSDGDYLPYNTDGLPNEPSSSAAYGLAGDPRAAEQPGLTGLHTVWVREHNWWAARLAGEHPDWSDERLYQTARAIVIAEFARVTEDALTALLGDGLPPASYDPTLHAGLANEFAAAVYRFGHSMVGDALYVLPRDGSEPRCERLADHFFVPDALRSLGAAQLLVGLAHQPAEEVDTRLVDSLRNFLHFHVVIDLLAANLARAADHGLPWYHVVRRTAGDGKAVTSWADITTNNQLADKLAAVYGPDGYKHLDLIIGILAEDHLPGSSLGPTGTAIIKREFAHMRDSDPYYWEWNTQALAGHEDDVRGVSLKHILVRTLGVRPDELPDNVFFVH